MPRFNPQLPIFDGPMFRIRIVGELFGQTTINTLYYGRPTGGGTTIPTPEAFTLAFTTAVSATWEALISEDWTGTAFLVDRFDEPLLPTVNLDNGWAGAVMTPAAESWVQFKMRRFCNIAGQRGRGEIRIAGIPEASTIANKLSAAALIAASVLSGVLQANLATANPTDGNWAPMLAYRRLTLTPLPVAEVHALPVVLWEATASLGSQLSRKPKSNG